MQLAIAICEKIDSAQADNKYHIETMTYKVSPLAYNQNFNKHFDSHYAKINTYKNNLIQSGKTTMNDTFVVGFWIECLFPPYYCKNGKFMGELFYFQTKQFKEKILNSDDLDFILFSSYADGQKRLFYFDKLTPFEDKCVDLERDNIVFPSINNNEATMYGKFTEDAIL